LTEYDCTADPPSISGVIQETRALVAVGASIVRARGAEGIASGITRAEVVFVLASTAAVEVMVTIFAS
jgi:hypothetical protein